MRRNIKNYKTAVKKNDTVIAITGRNKGKKGKVLEVIGARGKVIVEGLSFVKRHAKPTQQNQQGGIFEKEAPVSLSNVLIYCSSCDRGVRVTNKILDDKTKLRVCRICGNEI